MDPLQAHLVVADESRTEKTICLAVSPALKAYGISGRARLFEVVQRVREINRSRRPGEPLLEYIAAPPRMGLYMDYSNRVYKTYLKFVSSEDIHVYSVDEVFIDATAYLRTYRCTAHELALRMVREVLKNTGITATAGIGPNLYLAKVAMDVEAKHQQADADGVRIAELTERSYREKYWDHEPLTDFWRFGHGITDKLRQIGIRTLGDIARCSIGHPCSARNEETLYRLFGVGAEIIIDHAWGWEPCTIADIKAYKPATHSLSRGQVLSEPYDFEKTRIIIKEMTDLLSLDLVRKKIVTDQLVLSIAYDSSCAKDYKGDLCTDYYGRPAPKPAHGSINLGRQTSSSHLMAEAMMKLFDRIVNPALLVRRMAVVANHTVPEDSVQGIQMDLFEDNFDTEKERRRQEAILDIQKKFGKNAILKGTNFAEGATTIERNKTIGGHKA